MKRGAPFFLNGLGQKSPTLTISVLIWSQPKKKKPPMGTKSHKGLFRSYTRNIANQ